MNSLDAIRRLHQHRQWVSGNVLAAARRLSDSQLRERFEIGQGSVWRSLLHMQAAEFVWLEALQGNPEPLFPGDVFGKLPGNQEGAEAIASFDELERRWRELDHRWNGYLASLTAEALGGTVYKTSTSSGAGKQFGTSRLDVLLHVCTHAHYTTAQIVNMLRQLGQTGLPDAMLISLARAEANPQAI